MHCNLRSSATAPVILGCNSEARDATVTVTVGEFIPEVQRYRALHDTATDYLANFHGTFISGEGNTMFTKIGDTAIPNFRKTIVSHRRSTGLF